MNLNPLNPAAGGVPVPEDERELEAALRAGVVSYRVFPYLAWRYGSGGEKYTQSDSAWLAWLTRHPQSYVDEQINWLRNVLSNRGMPTWILEVHLRLLYRQLVRTIPGKREAYACLSKCAVRLRQICETSISVQKAQELRAGFVATLHPCRNPLIDHAAELLIGAVADERTGVKNSVQSLTVWLGDVPKLRAVTELRLRFSTADSRWFDSTKFDEQWQNAIANTIDKARNA